MIPISNILLSQEHSRTTTHRNNDTYTKTQSSQAELCRKHNLSDVQLSKWKRKLLENAVPLFEPIDKQTNACQRFSKSSKGNPIDVVLVVDRSGSMRGSIRDAVEHLADVVDAYKAPEIDYMLGLTIFYAIRYSRKIDENRIRNITAYAESISIQTGILLNQDLRIFS